MNATQVSLPTAKPIPNLADYGLQTSHASVYNIPERSQARVTKPSLLRYTEDNPTINILDTDEKYCLTGYGEISVSEHYDVIETGEDEKHLRVPRLRHVRPRARHQTVKTVSDPVGRFNSDDPNEPLLTSDIQQFEPEYFRNAIRATSTPPDTPSTDFREFFENLLRKPPPTRRRKRSLILPISFGSEAVDARPRSN